MTTNLLDLDPAAAADTLREFAIARGEPAYRGGQVARRLWHAPAGSFEEMTELPKTFRAALAETFSMPRLEVASRQKSTDGTEKFLFRLRDGRFTLHTPTGKHSRPITSRLDYMRTVRDDLQLPNLPIGLGLEALEQITGEEV